MEMFQRLKVQTAVFMHDVVAIPIAWFGAYWLRFNLESIPQEYLLLAVAVFPIVIAVQAAVFWNLGMYRGIWRFASMADLVRILKAVALGTAAIAVAIFFVNRMEGVPRSIFPIYGLLLVAFTGGPRFLYRWIKDRKLYSRSGKKALIVGGGTAAEILIRDLLRDPQRVYEPVAVVDDDAAKWGQEIHGVRVLGSSERIASLALGVEVILIALPSATSQEMRRIVEICEKTRVPFRTLPKLEDLVSGKVTVRALRDVKIDDLLGREAVKLDWNTIRGSILGRCIMVTGGGGSIGSELCRQIANLQPASLVVLEQTEFNLYSIDMELRRAFPAMPLFSVLGDVGDLTVVEQSLQRFKPDVIFHAAAYKHVPLLEHQPRPAVRNNVFGTSGLARLADKYGVASFVLISTDKAVNPTNVMGATKHIAEIYCQSLNERSKTQFITVRFGNVLGSAGSVIPLFQKQIAEGGPVTVTDPSITRYFMTIPEAAQLILQASSVGKGGEIFVLDMGEPVNIRYLAEQLILLSGKRIGEDIEIVYTGMRPGEKPYEELFHHTEALIETSHPKTMLARGRHIALEIVEREIELMKAACDANNDVELKQLLHKFLLMSSAGTESRPASRSSVVKLTPKT